MNRTHSRIAAVLALFAGLMVSNVAFAQEVAILQGKVLDAASIPTPIAAWSDSWGDTGAEMST